MESGQSKIFGEFREWLKVGSYSDSAISQYSVAVRLAIGLLDTPYLDIDLDIDFGKVHDYLVQYPIAASTLATYSKGLAKLVEYLRYLHQQPSPQPVIDWDNYLASFPGWLADNIQSYIKLRRRAWPPEQGHQTTLNLLSHLTGTLRHLIGTPPLADLAELTPAGWDEYVDQRLEAGINPTTLNRQLYDLQSFLYFQGDQGKDICERMLALKPLDTADPLPRDVPPYQLRQLLHEIQAEVEAAGTTTSCKGVMDRAWFHLMVYSGLRTGEIRRLRLGDLDLTHKQVRIKQSKGLQDRVVYLSPATVEALQAYLAIQGSTLTDHVFVYQHQPLSSSYCNRRLRHYGRSCGLQITAHQLRYSCGTLLLNAGLPILTLQHILGHQRVETTLRYARLYDSTVTADYGRAMAAVERTAYREENVD